VHLLSLRKDPERMLAVDAAQTHLNQANQI